MKTANKPVHVNGDSQQRKMHYTKPTLRVIAPKTAEFERAKIAFENLSRP